MCVVIRRRPKETKLVIIYVNVPGMLCPQCFATAGCSITTKKEKKDEGRMKLIVYQIKQTYINEFNLL